MCSGGLALSWPDVLVSESPATRDIWTCQACGSHWTTLPRGTGTWDYYLAKPAADHDRLEVGASRFRRIRTSIERVLGTSRYSILDVGCAQGAHLMAYPPSVAKACVEPSVAARSVLAARKIEWLGAHIDDLDGSRTFDVVTCLDVLEHVEDPAAMLRSMDRHVRAGGLLIVVTGNVTSFSARLSGRRWLYYALPEHWSFPSEAGLRSELETRLAYRVLRTTWIPNEEIRVRYVARFGIGVLRELAWRIARRASQSGGGRDGSFPFFVDSNLLLVARKTEVGKRPE
jgi:SAM-dependent methyltransferase